jgi:predicted secreted protein
LFAASTVILLPFGVKTDEEAGTPKVPGQADSAPHRFDLPRHLLKAAVLGAILTALYVANWTYGWVTAADLDFYN